MKSIAVKLICFSLLLLFTGCGHKPAPFMPETAELSPISPDIVADTKDRSTLQVFIVYGPSSSNHVALRIYHPKKGTVFWDPAGYYGIQGSITANRINDILVEDAPTITDYISFRVETEFPSKAMEIFEWTITDQKADYLQQVLKIGSKTVIARQGLFVTKGIGLYCGADVSGFLETFADDIMTIQRTFFPHYLEKQLYGQSPDRVIFVDFDEPDLIKKVQIK